MNIGTNLHGRLRNTSLPYSHGLLPLFEGVVNSIHALEEADLASDKGWIQVAIDRAAVSRDLLDSNETEQEARARGEIVGFTISDNGIGFNDENFEAFMTLDTDHKVAKGGRGIGRLLWLKAFDRAIIRSRFVDAAANLKERSFTFGVTGVTGASVVTLDKSAERETTIRLVGFDKHYRAHSRKTGEAIANAMLEHCLWYFVRVGGAPTIVIEDAGENIALGELFDHHTHSLAVPEQARVKDRVLELLHVKLRASSSTVHAIAYCADNRLVLEESLRGESLVCTVNSPTKPANSPTFVTSVLHS